MKQRLADQDGRPLCEVCGRYFLTRALPHSRYAHLACLYPGTAGPADLIPCTVTDRDLDAVPERRQRAGLAPLPDMPAADTEGGAGTPKEPAR